LREQQTGKTKLRKDLFRELRAGLEAHEVVEEEVLYPEIDQLATIKSVIENAFEEHAEFDAILQDIAQLAPSDPEWLYRIRELREMVQKHMQAEEQTMFPAAGSKLGKTRAQELGQKAGTSARNF
jgi:iron-sulfur cluster repair protein YtfE (RIC family)